MMPRVSANASPRVLLSACGGFYNACAGDDGKLSPLVGYNGRYGADNLQYVGFLFANFAMVDRWPSLVSKHVAMPLTKKLDRYLSVPITFSAAPEGGKVLGQALANLTEEEYVFPEKVVTVPATPTSREQSELRFNGRHELHPGSECIIVEDVCNNFSTTAQFIDEIHARGCEVVAIACFLNRSPVHRQFFVHNGVPYPIVALWDEAFPEYEQDDPMVAEHIRNANVLWKPKPNWKELESRAPARAFM